jgi:hypothetical protein
MSIQEMIQEARAVAVSPLDHAISTQARALVKIAARDGSPFKVASSRDLGPYPEAGSSPHSRRVVVTYLRPDGKVSGWVENFQMADAAEEMLREYAA